jgi:hypothetical protein
MTRLGGDLFGPLPITADAYVLKSIVHDWPDEQAVTILENCRRAMPTDAVVLLIERIMTGPPYPPTARLVAFSDLNMLVGPGGRERTVDKYGELLKRAGLYLARVVPTATDVSIIEARLAG